MFLISAQPQEFLELLQTTGQTTGIPVTAELYKRPKPMENPQLEEFGYWKGDISCVRREPVGEELFGPRLGDRAQTLFRQLIPIYDYFNPITSGSV